MTSAVALKMRFAAKLIRERADWAGPGLAQGAQDSQVGSEIGAAKHIALWSPSMAKLVADWLDATAHEKNEAWERGQGRMIDILLGRNVPEHDPRADASQMAAYSLAIEVVEHARLEKERLTDGH